MTLISVPEIAEQLNAQAATIAPDLLPNGHRSGNKWMASGIDDTGKSASLAVTLTGVSIGRWTDYGNAAADEQKGDMIDLIRLKLCGGDMGGAVAEAKRRLGIHDEFRPGQKIDPALAEKRAAEARARAVKRDEAEAEERALKARRARGLYLAGVAIAGTSAEQYLRGRGLQPATVKAGKDPEWPGSLRYHAEVWHKGERCKVPAMLAGIFNAAGQQVGTHRIYLHNANGRTTKLPGGEAKLVLGNMWGGFVPINKGISGKSMAQMPPEERVYVTEGIEDAVCVRQVKPEARIVAAISLGNIGAIVLPEAARRLIIVADRDDNQTAQETLERSIAAQQARGLQVELVMPPPPHKDVNDWFQALARHEAERLRA